MVISEDTRACHQDGKSAAIHVQDGKAVFLVGVYSPEYIATENPDLYETEVALLREAFGPAQSEHAPSGALEWAVSDDRVARIVRRSDGIVVLDIGLRSSAPDDKNAVTNALVTASLTESPRLVGNELDRRRIERFKRESIGGLRFGMTIAEAREACAENNGRWGISDDVSVCNHGSEMHSAFFCGSRVCSLVMIRAASTIRKLGYNGMVHEYDRRYGQGVRSRSGQRDDVTWKLDSQKSVEISLASFADSEVMTVKLYSKGKQ